MLSLQFDAFVASSVPESSLVDIKNGYVVSVLMLIRELVVGGGLNEEEFKIQVFRVKFSF